MKKYKKIRSKLCIFISFFLSFIIALLFITTSVLLGGLNHNVIMNDLKKSNYYQKSYEAFIEQANLIANQFGLSEDVISENITIEDYHVKANNYVRYASKNMDTAAIELAIDMELDHIVRQWNDEKKEKYSNVTIEESEKMELCANEIASVYIRSIDFPYINEIATYRETFFSFLKIVLPIALLAIAILIITLFVSNKYKHRALRYIVYAVFGADLVTLMIGMYLLGIKSELIQTDGVRYQAFLEVYYKDSITPLFIIFSAGALVVVILQLIVRHMRIQLIARNNND